MAQQGNAPALDYVHARDVAVRAAYAAAGLIRFHAGRMAEAQVRLKQANDLVTEVDEAAQARIVETLLGAYPDHDILAEEGVDLDAIEAGADRPRWIVDPIDGTTNFTHGVPPYGVSIALQEGDEVVVGVVLDVARDELFTATRGGGCYVDGLRVSVSQRAPLNQCLLTTGFPYRTFGHITPYLEVLGGLFEAARGIRRPGVASLDLAYVAAGRFDGFFETGLRPWDVAAGTLMVREAGGQVTNYGGGPEAIFGQQILATNGRIHDALLNRLVPMRDIRL